MHQHVIDRLTQAIARERICFYADIVFVCDCRLQVFRVDQVDNAISYIREQRGTMENSLKILKQQDGEVAAACSEKLWCGLLDYTTAYADSCLTFTFKNSSTFEA